MLPVNLAFVTVMDVDVIDTAFTEGKSYVLVVGGAGTVDAPIVLTAQDTDLEALLGNSTVGGITVDTVTTSLDTIVLAAGAESATIDLTDGSVTMVTATVAVLVIDAHLAAELIPADTALATYIRKDATLECLTISNVSQEGPRKEVRGGREAKPCVRYGKTMRLEMEGVVFNKEALATIGGANISVDGNTISVDDSFPDAYAIVGNTAIVNKLNGGVENIWLVFPEFLTDGVFDINMESEGDLGMMSLAGELFPNADGDFFYIREKV